MDGRSIVVGRDRNHAGAVVAGLENEVCVRDLGVDGIAAPDENQVRVVQVVCGAEEADLARGDGRARIVVGDLGVGFEHRRIEHADGAREPEPVAAVGDRASHVPDDGSGPILDDRVDGRVGDLAKRLVPGHPLPAALAARADPLERMEQPGRGQRAGAVAGAFLAAARVEVGHRGVGLRVVAHLLLAPDDPVLHVDVPDAALLVGAVHVVGAARHPVPGPFLPVDVAEVRVLGEPGERSARVGGRLRRAEVEVHERERERRSRALEEAAPREQAHARAACVVVGQAASHDSDAPRGATRSATARRSRHLERHLPGGVLPAGRLRAFASRRSPPLWQPGRRRGSAADPAACRAETGRWHEAISELRLAALPARTSQRTRRFDWYSGVCQISDIASWISSTSGSPSTLTTTVPVE